MFLRASNRPQKRHKGNSTTEKRVVLKCPYNTGALQHNFSNMEKQKKNKDEWGCKWYITVNAPTLTALFMTVKISDMPVPVVAYKIGYEVGASGNLHKHMYLVFERSWRRSALINRFKGSQIDRVTPGTEQTVIDYICNDDKPEEKSSVNLWFEVSGEIWATQGQRNDITASDAVLWQIKDAIDAGASLGEIYGSFFPYMVRYGQGIKNYHDFKLPRMNKRLVVVTEADEEQQAA